MAITNLEIAALIAQVHLFSTKMHPLAHIHIYMDNMAAQRWSNRFSISSATAVGTILQNISLLTRTHQIYASAGRTKGADNTMADFTSRLTHLHERMFLRHFTLTFSQKNSWRLLTCLLAFCPSLIGGV